MYVGVCGLQPNCSSATGHTTVPRPQPLIDYAWGERGLKYMLAIYLLGVADTELTEMKIWGLVPQTIKAFGVIYKSKYTSVSIKFWIKSNYIYVCFILIVIYQYHGQPTISERSPSSVADPGGGGATWAHPPRVQILSFWHTNFSKRSCLGSWRPLQGWRPPYGKSWIRHCSYQMKFILLDAFNLLLVFRKTTLTWSKPHLRKLGVFFAFSWKCAHFPWKCKKMRTFSMEMHAFSVKIRAFRRKTFTL